MSLLLPLILGALWIPVDSGPDTPSLALTLGGDGLIYSAQAGLILQRGQEGWRAVAQYAPSLSWDGDEINADGPFSREVLHEATQRAEIALEAKGLELGAHFEQELVESLLLEIVTELDPPSDSLYRVYDMVAAPDGVWLASGGGLFRPGQPPMLVGRVFSLAPTPDRLYYTTPQGLFELRSGASEGDLLLDSAEVVTRWGERVVTLYEGRLSPLFGDPLPPAPALFVRVVGGPRALWAEGGEGLWRLDEGGWRACGALPEPPTRLRITPHGLLIVAEGGLYTTDQACAEIVAAPRSWISQARFTDGLYFRGALWAATSHGLLRRGRVDEANPRRVAEFKQAVDALPPLHRVVEAAIAHQSLGQEAALYGNRPLWRYVLPTVRAALSWDAQRYEDNPTLIRGSHQLTLTPPRFDYAVYAEWQVDLGAFAPQSTDQEWARQLLDSGAPVVEEVAEAEAEELVLFGTETTAAPSVDIDALVALQANQLNRDRQRLIEHLRGLYAERLRLLYQLWLSDGGQRAVYIEPNPQGIEAGLNVDALAALLPPDWEVEAEDEALVSPREALLEVIATRQVSGRPLRHWANVSLRARPPREAVEWVLRMDELDALLDAATGDAWGQALRAAAP